MNYTTFLNQVRDQMEEQLGKSHTLVLRQIAKNNGLVLDGLCITKGHSPIAPTIYLNSYYSEYSQGKPMTQIISELCQLYWSNRSAPSIHLADLSCLERVRHRIAFKLIHAASNQKLLEDIPHIPYLDLAIVFYLYVDQDEYGQMTALIHRSHLDAWGLREQELYQLARDNTPRLFPAIIRSMKDVIEDLLSNASGDKDPGESFPQPGEALPSVVPLYVLSNSTGINGAVCMIYEDILRDFAGRLESDLIILPSSIHEVLILADQGDARCEELESMVTDINQRDVAVEDRLSNRVYRYSRLTGRISVASPSGKSIETLNPQ